VSQIKQTAVVCLAPDHLQFAEFMPSIKTERTVTIWIRIYLTHLRGECCYTCIETHTHIQWC